MVEVKTLRVTPETHARIMRMKRYGESHDGLVRRLLDTAERADA